MATHQDRNQVDGMVVTPHAYNTDRAKDDSFQDGSSSDESSNIDANPSILYRVWEVPPLPITLILGFQHYLTMLGATVVIPTLLVPAMGGDDDDKAQVIQSIFFASGLNTLLQTTWGDRLPIVQGGSFSFITPAFTIIGNVAARNTFASCEPDADVCHERFLVTMRELQGAIIGAACIQIFIGYSGLMSVLLKYISPLTIAPTIALVGLSLVDAGWGNATSGVGSCVQIGIPTIALLILFSQYLKVFKPNLPFVGKTPVFALFPVLFTIVAAWLIALIYTEAGDPSNAFCRTDNTDVLSTTPWVRIPYPGQWGTPTFSASSIFAMFAGVLAGIVESVGDYYACARLAGAPPPSVHVISRGCGAEGIGCVIAGLIGTTNGTTSYSENVGAIGLTGVGSRRVIQCTGLFMLFFSIFGKFGALFASLPTPIVGGLFCVVFGMIAGIGLSNFSYVDGSSMRNIFILGFSLYNGLSIAGYFAAFTEEEGHGPVNTGSQEFNDIFNTLFETPMAVGLMVAFALDNTMPGTFKERGLHHWNLKGGYKAMSEKAHWSYDLPFGLSPKIEYPLLDFMNGLQEKLCGCMSKKDEEALPMQVKTVPTHLATP